MAVGAVAATTETTRRDLSPPEGQLGKVLRIDRVLIHPQISVSDTET